MTSLDFKTISKTFPVVYCNPTDCLLDWTDNTEASNGGCQQINQDYSQTCLFDVESITRPYQLDFYKAKFGHDREYNLLLRNYCGKIGIHPDCEQFSMTNFCAAYPNHPDCASGILNQSSSHLIFIFIFIFLVIMFSWKKK
jgi:hypothetical protein